MSAPIVLPNCTTRRTGAIAIHSSTVPTAAPATPSLMTCPTTGGIPPCAAFPCARTAAGNTQTPANRRYHAEATCCPVCGPRLWAADSKGREIAEGPHRPGPRLACGRQNCRHQGDRRLSSGRGRHQYRGGPAASGAQGQTGQTAGRDGPGPRSGSALRGNRRKDCSDSLHTAPGRSFWPPRKTLFRWPPTWRRTTVSSASCCLTPRSITCCSKTLPRPCWS